MKDPQIQRMIHDIEREVQYTRKMIGTNALSPGVMTAMSNTPRNEFVPKSYLDAAFDNGPLPIGHGQTISQPYIVALMTDMLELEADDVILEIGTGSGYQTAILSQLCKKVYTIEYVPALADAASARLKRLGYNNIEAMTGNGYEGWPEHAPYDGIIVTAAASHIPRPLVEQLKPGGRLVIPVGRPHLYQELTLVEKDENGEIHMKHVLGVAFVPLQGERNAALR
ncbi:MAG: protein-L-isoaspartate(D-aspartate) O-methyltransferase [Gammaproteobacteria bacterium]|jgi:protein-L-isoaspartate(D-aspartate) O-methyltransferase